MKHAAFIYCWLVATLALTVLANVIHLDVFGTRPDISRTLVYMIPASLISWVLNRNVYE